jgi:hypothetical protein
MKIGDTFTLTEIEQQIVELVSNARQDNKEATNVSTATTVADDDNHRYRHKIGFGAEFLFCKHTNVFPDFWIGNYSKYKGTDEYDAVLNGMSVDVKTSDSSKGNMYPLMIPEYSKTDCNLFAYFHCIYPRYRFAGYATKEMLYKEENKRKTKVLSYVLELKDLIELQEVYGRRNIQVL